MPIRPFFLAGASAPLRGTPSSPSTLCLTLLVGLLVAAIVSSSIADEVVVETIVSDLRGPCGLAVRPNGAAEQFELYFAESGAGRIVRLSSDIMSPVRLRSAIRGFASGTAGDESLVPMVPRSLLFLDAGLLAVGGASPDGGGLLLVYELSPDRHSATADQFSRRHSVLSPVERSASVAVSCVALARTRANVFVPDVLLAATQHTGGQAALLRSRVQADMLGDWQPVARRGPARGPISPRGLAVSNAGYIVVADANSPDVPGDSRLVFLSPIDQSPVLSLDTGLDDVIAVAYSPVTGRLYALDAAELTPDRGAVYRLDDASEPGRPACQVVKIIDVRRPTALAFGPDGALYVAAEGSDNGGGALLNEGGALLKVTGDL